MKYFPESPVIVLDGSIGRDLLWGQLQDAISVLQDEVNRMADAEDMSPRFFRLDDTLRGLEELASAIAPYHRDREALAVARKHQFIRAAEAVKSRKRA